MQIHENFQKNLKSQCPISFNAFEIIYDGNPQLYCLKTKIKMVSVVIFEDKRMCSRYRDGSIPRQYCIQLSRQIYLGSESQIKLDQPTCKQMGVSEHDPWS